MASTSRTQHRCRCWAVGCLGAALTAGTGCGAPLCPSATFAASVAVALDEAWTSLEELVVTVGCPAGDATGCGFLDGPVHAPATASVVLYTVLRPAEVDVVVSRATTGDVVARGQFPVTYEPFGPKQTQCGGEAHALVVVPVG